MVARDRSPGRSGRRGGETGSGAVVMRASGGAIAALGGAVLVGWATGAGPLLHVSPGLPNMQPATAVCFVCIGMALVCTGDRWRPGRRVVPAAAGLAGVVAALSLVRRAGGPRSPVELVLFPDAVARDPHRGTMAVATALLILLLSASLATPGRARPGHAFAAQALALTALVGSVLALLDHLYGPNPPLLGNVRSVMALHTAAGLAVASTGALAAVPDGLARHLLEQPGPGSAMRRRLLLVIAVGLPLLGWLRVQGERLGLYGPSFGVAVFVVVAGALVYTVAWSATGAADRSGAMLRDAWHRLGSTTAGLERQVAEQAAELAEARARLDAVLEVLGDGAPVVVTDPDGRVAMASARAVLLLGLTEAEAVGRPLAALDREVRRSAADRAHILAEDDLDVVEILSDDVTDALGPGRP